MCYQPKTMFVGHIVVLGGPHVARGPDVAQACSTMFACKNIVKSTGAKTACRTLMKLTLKSFY